MWNFLANTAAVVVLTATSPVVLFMHDALTAPTVKRGGDAPAASLHAARRAGEPDDSSPVLPMASIDRRAPERPHASGAARSVPWPTTWSKGG